jgi:nitrite reductase/ring-hydroxylating ferredoxin subunit
MAWIKAATIDQLETRPVVLKHAPFQVLVLRSGGELYAVDNRCPHEGYPLAEGTLAPESAVLTCNWHNWKFRLSDGHCLLGGDNVRTYPVRVEDGDVFVDLSRRDPADSERRILAGLKLAFDERDFGRVCREIARLEYEGLPSVTAVRQAVRWWHDRLEFGTTHAMAAMVDWLDLGARWSRDRERNLICLSEAVDHFSFDALRQPHFPYPESGEPFSFGPFVEFIEAEHVGDAEAMVRRGLADGLAWNDMEEAFIAASLDHYNSFGHCLIYVSKMRGAVDALGPDMLPFLALPLVRTIGFATREDRVPEFRAYRSVVEALPDPIGVGDVGASHQELSNREALAAPFPSTLAESFSWLGDVMGRYPVVFVYDALLDALARNMLHCDLSYDTASDRPVSQNVGWLDFTHGITFANAVRVTAARYPRFWKPGLAQMACFLGRNSAFIDRGLDTIPWKVSDPERFLESTFEGLLDHGLRDPIFPAHLLKTSVAVRDELPPASGPCRDALLASLNRLVHSPIKMKHVRRNVRQAMALVSRDYA